MRFKEFVFKNTLRNKNLYLAYFLSTLSTVMSFFAFAVFAFHPNLSSGLHSAVRTGLMTAAVIIYLFSFFYVLYSMDIFLQSRKKEFGLLLIQGMSPKQLRKMVFQENSIIGFLATISGIIIGFFFSQGLLWVSKVTMRVDLPSYLPIKAAVVTVLSFMVLFLLISVFIQFKIPKMDVQTLLKSNDLGKGDVKVSKIKAILAVVLVGGGYAVALTVTGVQVVMAMVPVIIMVILGTNFLFNQLSVLVVHRLQKNETLFWKKTNMLVFSDLGFRMKDNARSFFLVAVITTVAFSAIGSLVGFKEMSLKGVNSNPYDFYVMANMDEKENSDKLVQDVTQSLEEHDIKSSKVIINSVNYASDEDQVSGIFIRESNYNEVATLLGEATLDTKQTVYALDEVSRFQEIGPTKEVPKTLTVEGQDTINVVDTQVQKAVISTFGNVFVVSDALYEAVASKGAPEETTAWVVDKGSFDDQAKVGEAFRENYLLQSKAYTTKMITEAFAPVLFIGFFIGLIFFISAGSFLYFRLYSDMDVDKEKFNMVHKLGFSRKEMKKVVYQQVGILFFTPVIVSSIHGIVALKAMYSLFGQPLQMTAFVVLGTFLAVQLVYYLIARVLYFNKLYRLITE